MPELIKAEMWDKMQYLFRNYYDRMVHCVQYYDGPIDVKVLKRKCPCCTVLSTATS